MTLTEDVRYPKQSVHEVCQKSHKLYKLMRHLKDVSNQCPYILCHPVHLIIDQGDQSHGPSKK